MICHIPELPNTAMARTHAVDLMGDLDEGPVEGVGGRSSEPAYYKEQQILEAGRITQVRAVSRPIFEGVRHEDFRRRWCKRCSLIDNGLQPEVEFRFIDIETDSRGPSSQKPE